MCQTWIIYLRANGRHCKDLEACMHQSIHRLHVFAQEDGNTQASIKKVAETESPRTRTPYEKLPR